MLNRLLQLEKPRGSLKEYWLPVHAFMSHPALGSEAGAVCPVVWLSSSLLTRDPLQSLLCALSVFMPLLAPPGNVCLPTCASAEGSQSSTQLQLSSLLWNFAQAARSGMSWVLVTLCGQSPSAEGRGMLPLSWVSWKETHQWVCLWYK